MTHTAPTTTDLLDEITLSALVPSGRGAHAKQLALEYVRDLNGGDLDMVLNPPKVGAVASPLARLRATHHALARLIAEGRKHVEAAAITGYSLSRISVLLADPAFKELVAYYTENKEQIYLDVHQRLAGLGVSSMEELQERLEAEPEKFKTKELMELVELTLDRSIAPKKGTTGQNGASPAVAVNITFTKSESASGLVEEGTCVEIVNDDPESP